MFMADSVKMGWWLQAHRNYTCLSVVVYLGGLARLELEEDVLVEGRFAHRQHDRAKSLHLIVPRVRPHMVSSLSAVLRHKVPKLICRP